MSEFTGLTAHELAETVRGQYGELRGRTERERALAELADRAACYEAALRHIADHYDAETAATVPADPERVGLEGPHKWIELTDYITDVLGFGACRPTG